MDGIGSQLHVRRSLSQRYLAYRRTVCRPGTVMRDQYTMDSWECYLETVELAVEEVTRQHCEEYMASLTIAPATRARVISQLRGFYGWLCDHEIVARNPWSKIQTPRQPIRVPRVLSEEEYARIDAALGGPSIRCMRDRSYIAFLYATGCRNGEALGLDMADLDLRRHQAVVLGKGDRERTVFFDDDTSRKITKWLKVREKWAKGFTGPVWVGRHGDRMCKGASRDVLIRAARDAGISRHIWPHLLRHSAATHLLQAGMNIRQLQELLGHADLASTQIYTHVDPAELHEAYDQAKRNATQKLKRGVHSRGA